VLLGVFVAVAMLVNMSEVEVNPTSKSPQALGHSGAEVTAFFIKVLMTLVSTFIGGWPKVASAAYLLLTFWLSWCCLRWAPHLVRAGRPPLACFCLPAGPDYPVYAASIHIRPS
jgi:hypothetical protein